MDIDEVLWEQSKGTMPERIVVDGRWFTIENGCTSAALAILTATGMSTAEATTGLRGVLIALVGPTETALTAAEDLGIGFGDGNAFRRNAKA